MGCSVLLVEIHKTVVRNVNQNPFVEQKTHLLKWMRFYPYNITNDQEPYSIDSFASAR